MNKYTAIIGMEIHVELKTNSKMFCACKNDPDHASPNTNICEICLAHPGTLPTPNKTAIELSVKIAKALGCAINGLSKFDRKHYFYPDLPKSYQISQYDMPIGENGCIELDFLPGKNHREKAKIGITRVHLEEDTAKLTHSTTGDTLVDFNRAGVPLIEIVSNPDIQSSAEAKAYCQELQSILRCLDASNADMEKGQMRCEANVSVQETGSFEISNGQIKPLNGARLNNKIELKNINSFRAIEKAIEYEIHRQIQMIEKDETWGPETRGWNDSTNQTVLQRTKETSADYRYFPEPDIPPFHPMKVADNITIPELPAQKRKRFREEYGFSYADAALLVEDNHLANYTEEVVTELQAWIEDLNIDKKNNKTHSLQELAKLCGGWITSKLIGQLAERKKDIRTLKIKPENFAELIALIYTNRLNSTNAQKVLSEMIDSGVDKDPTHIMEEKGYGQMNDASKLSEIIDNIIKNYPQQVSQFKAGKEPIMQFLKGIVMKATEGSADPQVAEKLLREKLK